jgi:hypothetical protein
MNREWKRTGIQIRDLVGILEGKMLLDRPRIDFTKVWVRYPTEFTSLRIQSQ